MLCGSQRHSDRLMPRWIAPVPPAGIAVPVTSSGSEGPCSRPEVTFWSLTDVEGAWNFFPPEEKIRFSEMRELCSLSRVASLPFWELVLLLVAKGEGQHSQDLGPVGPVTCQGLQTLQPPPDGSRKKQKAELHAGVSRTPHVGEQEQNKQYWKSRKA